MSTARNERPKVGVGVFILNDKYPGCILVGKRRNIHGDGLLQLPGGHLEFGERWEECAAREVEEECGVKLFDVKVCGVVNAVNRDNNYHYVDIVMQGNTDAEPRNLEPDKCDGWQWREFSSLQADDPQLFWPFQTLLKADCNPFNPNGFTFHNVNGD